MVDNFIHEFSVFFALSIAAFLFLRVGVINIGLEGLILIAAVIYAGFASNGDVLFGMIVALLVVAVLSCGLISLKLYRGMNDLLASMGLLYFCLGLAPLISVWFGGQAQNLPLKISGVMPNTILAGLVLSIIGVIALVEFLRPLRLAKIVSSGESEVWSRVHLKRPMAVFGGFLASVLITASAIKLVELGGSYTAQVSSHRGFLVLAVAVVAIAARKGWLTGLSILFAVVFTARIEVPWGKLFGEQLSGIGDIFPYASVIVVLAVVGFWRARQRQQQVDDGPTMRFDYELREDSRRHL